MVVNHTPIKNLVYELIITKQRNQHERTAMKPNENNSCACDASLNLGNFGKASPLKISPPLP